MKINFKNERGITTVDALIAIILLTLFVGLIATLAYNVLAISTNAKRNAMANNYIVDFYEYVDKLKFEDVTEETLLKYINENEDTLITATNSNEINNLTSPYKLKINVENYMPSGQTVDNLVKIVSVSLNYKTGKKDNTIDIQRIKSK